MPQAAGEGRPDAGQLEMGGELNSAGVTLNQDEFTEFLGLPCLLPPLFSTLHPLDGLHTSWAPGPC